MIIRWETNPLGVFFAQRIYFPMPAAGRDFRCIININNINF